MNICSWLAKLSINNSNFSGVVSEAFFGSVVDKNLEPFIINVPIKLAIPCLEALQTVLIINKKKEKIILLVKNIALNLEVFF
jgi:hypothetical protein